MFAICKMVRSLECEHCLDFADCQVVPNYVEFSILFAAPEMLACSIPLEEDTSDVGMPPVLLFLIGNPPFRPH